MSLAAGRKLFDPSGHLWLRAIKCSASKLSRHPLTVEIGLAPRGLADIGDVTAIKGVQTNNGWFAKEGDSLVVIDWDAHIISSADELYHTVWETVTEQTTLRSPVSGVVEKINAINTLKEDLDEDTVLARIKVDSESLHLSDEHLMGEDAYKEYLATIPPGKFSEE